MGKTTDFEHLRKKRRIRRVFKRTTWMMILALVICGGCLLWSLATYMDFGSRATNYLSSFTPGGGFPQPLDDMHVQQLLPMGTDVAVVTESGNYIYNKNGAKLYTCLNSYSNPITIGDGGKLLTFDAGGMEVKISTKTDLLYTLERTGNIFAADICKTGAFAIAESVRGALGMVTVYSAKNEEMYRWETSQGYIHIVELNQKGTAFVAVTVNVIDGKLVSYVNFHNFSMTQQLGLATLPDELVLSAVWTVDDRLQVITDRRLHIYDAGGTEIFVGDFPAGATIFENSEQGGMYFAYGDSRLGDGATVVGYDNSLRELGRWTVREKVLDLQQNGNRLLILTEQALYLGDHTLSQVKKRDISGITQVCGIDNVIYGVTAEGLIKTSL